MSKYTDEQYRRAKDVVETLPKEQADVVWKRIQEYEAEHSAKPSLSEGDVARLKQPPLTAPPVNDTTPPAYQFPDTLDMSLPNASKDPKFSAPPEYVSKTHSALATIAKNTLVDPLNGPASTQYFEPSEQQFQTDMGHYLEAKGVAPGSQDYYRAYARYKDAKWEQAYADAKTKDYPLTRNAHVPESASGWDKLSAYLGNAADVGSAFVKGFASGKTLGLTNALSTDADREQQARNPVAHMLGEFKGAASPTSLPSRLTAGVGRLGAAAGLGAYGSAALAGGVGAAADVGGHELGNDVSDMRHGRPTDPTERSHLTGRLLSGALIGGVGGTLGHSVANLAEGYRGYNRSGVGGLARELPNAETAGSTTSVVRGIEPAPSVESALERARGAAHGTAVEYAADDVRSPLVAQQKKDWTDTTGRIHTEKHSMYERDPRLKVGKGLLETGNELLKTALARSQPQEGAGTFMPGSDEGLAFEKNDPILESIRRLYKPRLVQSVDAAKEAARTGGRVVSLEYARKAGFKVKGLENELNPETGIPHNAPSLSDYSQVRESEILPDGQIPWYPQANPVEVLPKYGKEALAAHAAEVAGHPGATPEQAAALDKWSFGHDDAIRGVQRGTPDAEIIQKRLEAYGGPVDKLGVPHEQHLAEAKEAAAHIADYLKSTPPASKLPFVYRGLVLSREEAAKFLQNSSFDLGSAASSASYDPAVARSFVARNAKPGDVGITLKLEHNSARDIGRYARDRVKVEKELMLPPGVKGQIVARYEDASNPGHYIVIGKQAPPEADPFRTQPEIGAALPRDASGLSLTTEAGGDGGFTNNAGHDIELPDNLPKQAFKVILEPRPYDAMKTEDQIDAIDRAGKAGSKNGAPDPVFDRLIAAARADRRKNFGNPWADMIEGHGKDLTALEQRGVHTGIGSGAVSFDKLSGDAQVKVNGGVTNYGVAPVDTNRHLADLADAAGVRPGLEAIKGVRAYMALKESSSLKNNEGITNGGSFVRLGGFGPALRLRADAFARGLARGPDGLPITGNTVSPALADTPLGRSLLPSSGLLSMGGGALGLKSGSLYDSAFSRPGTRKLSPQELADLQRRLEQK